MTAIVSAQNVRKRFRIPMREEFSLRGRLLHPFSKNSVREFQALDDVSFEVEEGEFFGIVGRNGSGKSTLLKILAGIYSCDTGSVQVNGSLAPFIELGVGFNFELSGRDNVFLNGALLGLSRKQLLERYDHIVRFAELEEFMDLKLANFSSGMQVRLAFAIAVESDADVLLIDEVLAVGDERFQRKCFDVFRARKAAGKTIIFVSHDMGAVKEFCDRALLLHHGVVVDCGDTRVVAQSYLNLNAPEEAERELEFDTGWITDVRIGPVTEVNEGVPVLEHGVPAVITMEITAHRDIEKPSFGCFVTDLRGRPILASNTSFTDQLPARMAAGTTATVDYMFDNILCSGTYLIAATLEDSTQAEPLDVRRDVSKFSVHAPSSPSTIVDLGHRWEVAANRLPPTVTTS